ncbi:hypothetical protein SIO70_10190 [Chitinophaga sancti]|uniref:hypothetical protein n=1 Tax=Chitinophaga sancti TaxID=1004 RepID=UPI002A74A029|nr:hypothetical protein [Chitinophaga sancti]WPQ65212.1 hypothetical protein SIO70_10190 [Chitinophaga sancti]
MSAATENIDYKVLYEQLLPLLKSQQESNLQLQNQVTQLQYQLHQLTKLLGGFKSERFIPSGAQVQQELGLNFETAFATTNLSDVQKISYVKARQAPGKTAYKTLSRNIYA